MFFTNQNQSIKEKTALLNRFFNVYDFFFFFMVLTIFCKKKKISRTVRDFLSFDFIFVLRKVISKLENLELLQNLLVRFKRTFLENNAFYFKFRYFLRNVRSYCLLLIRVVFSTTIATRNCSCFQDVSLTKDTVGRRTVSLTKKYIY